MELQEFIKSTLTSISNGIHGANSGYTPAIFKMEHNLRDREQGYISFDIAVTVNEESKKSGGAGIKVVVASLGGKVGNQKSQEVASRIKFYVMPNQNIA